MAVARAQNVGLSTINLRRVADLVRGKSLEEAVNTLRFIPSAAAQTLLKTIESAAANAETNDLKDRQSLRVIKVTADQGPMVRRFRAKARGRAGAFNRSISHITVVVDEPAATTNE